MNGKLKQEKQLKFITFNDRARLFRPAFASNQGHWLSMLQSSFLTFIKLILSTKIITDVHQNQII